MSDVFISYKAEDRRRVQPLVHALQSDGLSVWWDEHIGTGDAWRETIERHLTGALCVVVMWSKRSVGPQGGFVREEASRALKRGVYVPVLIDAVDPPLGFGESQATSLKGWNGDRSDPRYAAVLAAIERNTGTKAGARAAAPSPAANRISRRAVVGGAAGAVAAAGIGGWFLLKPTAANASLNSVAVLPFANLSGDPNQAYFSDGIAEEIRSALTRLSGLQVVGRSSSEAVRNDDAQSAAKKLDVACILTGSVRQSPSTIRVSAELVDGRTGMDRWSQDYDRSPGDAIKIQTDIARNVASALGNTLGVSGGSPTAGGTDNVEAQKLVMEAYQAASSQTKIGVQRALALTDQAIALDPHYSTAYARKAVYLNWFASTFAQSLPELFKYRRQALDAAKIALAMAPDSGDAHHALAEIYRVVLKFKPALAEYERAYRLSPGQAELVGDYGYFLNRIGRFKQSFDLADKTRALDPLSAGGMQLPFFCMYGARRYQDAVDYSKQVERDQPQLFLWPEFVGFALVFLKRYDEAQVYFDRSPADSYNRIVGLATLYARTGHVDRIDEQLATLKRLYGDPASYQFGQINAQKGDKEAAFASLGKAWDIRDSGLLNLRTDEMMDPLRSDPRFAALLAKLDFPA